MLRSRPRRSINSRRRVVEEDVEEGEIVEDGEADEIHFNKQEKEKKKKKDRKRNHDKDRTIWIV